MKTTHSIIVCITLFVSSISFVFGYNKAKDGTYYADFNGDGKHDIFLYDKTKGTGVVWGWDGNKWKTLWENNTFRKTWEVHLGDFDGNGKTIEELEKAENIDDSLLRYLTVKVKKHDLKTNYFGKKDF